MKVLFSYGTYNNRPHKACCVYESNNRENDEVIIDYLSTLERLSWMSKVLEMLRDPTITRDWIDSQAFEALIEHDQIKVGFYLLDDMEEEDIPDDVDERDTAPRFIPRKEFAYLLEKWLDFYHRPITDMNYQEIIDTKDAY
ncbi:DUF5376 domain-containing protein [Pasteurella multocida]|uniref:DUF5376 domain-containing protein n=1 Tax=Pasteurella multocida TaxID=747 RepID=UPI0028781AD9|nr:DUF5376 domain-containing protein [Pasteurella multocida]MEB3476878.1 DUF5376 domain-containing protein [Pasteurella multocida]MEB3507627.1 DUF5376 domain-containing protein [Pasteurella multocida]WRJ99396.1 DUF5376 domain-containing protein [Pasteurella multocida]WVM64146.1 DUF5376 domain-containing protein [Pasteurella multocida]HDX1086752.1 DUF5376 domain-containing protein [Pasteurella multocida]